MVEYSPCHRGPLVSDPPWVRELPQRRREGYKCIRLGTPLLHKGALRHFDPDDQHVIGLADFTLLLLKQF